VAAAVVLVRACGEPEPVPFDGAVVDLLGREPDRVHDQPGVLLPAGEEPWGPCGLTGWIQEVRPPELERTADAVLHVETNQPTASLSLPVVGAHARTIELTLWCPGPFPDPTVTVRLNDVELHVVEAGAGPLRPTVAPRVHALEAPAEAWVEGDNVLELEVARDPETGAWPTVCVARVAYDRPLEVRRDPSARSLRLPSSTAVSYAVEAPDPAQVSVRATDGVPGRLRIAERSFDPETGDALEPPLATWSLDGARLGEEVRLDLAASPTGVRVLDLAWEAGAGAPLELDRLAVVTRERWERPPVVLISIDTFAASHASVYGYERDTTPNLRALAEGAVVFERCVANAPWTMPSYLSMISGLYPQSHKRTDLEQPRGEQEALGAYAAWQVADNRWTMAEMLRAMGYRTAAYVDTQWLWKPFRFHQGFDLYDIEASKLTFTVDEGGIMLIHHNVAEWLESQAPGEPFFLFVHALDAHGPYWPGPAFLDAFPAHEPPGGWTYDWAGSAFQTYQSIPTWMALTLARPPEPVPSELPVEPIVARYDETLLKTDAFLGKIFDELRARGVFDEAVVIVTGDHGEAFRPDFYGHGAMWNDVVRVPLLVRFPHGRHGGTRVSGTVQLVDLYPTLLELLRGSDRPWLHGRSLLAAVEDGAAAPVPIYSEEGHCEQYLLEYDGWKLVVEYPARQSAERSLLTHPRVPPEWLAEHAPELLEGPLSEELFARRFRAPLFRAEMAELRALLEGPFVSLYRVADDPGDARDLAAEHPEVVERLQGMLASEQERWRHAQGLARWVPHVSLSEDAKDALRDLGYLEPK